MKGSVAARLGLLAFLLVALGVPARAQDRHAVLIVDANDGQVLYSEKADELRHPASLTKMMTLYLAFEAIERGRASYATRIRVSREASSQPPTRLNLDPGESIALIDAIRALITKSANDAAVAVAEHLGGSEANFARMMTEKARLFGMSRTVFRNASGLPDSEQVTTARDMVRLALRLQDDFPRHYQLFSTRSFAYQGRSYRNHNNLLGRFQGTDGIKTGYTRASGFNLVSSVRRGGRHVVGAIFGGSSAARRDDAMQLLLARALTKASPYRTRRPAPVLVASAAPAARPEWVRQPAPYPAPPAVQPPPSVAAPYRPYPAPPAARFSEALPPAPAPVPAVRPMLARSTTSDAEPPRMASNSGSQLGFTQTQTSPARGLPPSTLQQQAAQLTRAGGGPVPPAPTLMRGTHPGGPRSGPIGAGFEIQIGAYNSETDAERALLAARNTAGDLLQRSEARAIPVATEARRIFRARFVGFDSQVATSTCQELRRRRIDCLVVRAQ